jgi:hypothetical protein
MIQTTHWPCQKQSNCRGIPFTAKLPGRWKGKLKDRLDEAAVHQMGLVRAVSIGFQPKIFNERWWFGTEWGKLTIGRYYSCKF